MTTHELAVYHTIVGLPSGRSVYQQHQLIASLFNRRVDLVEAAERPYLYRNLNRTLLEQSKELDLFIVQSQEKPQGNDKAVLIRTPKIVTISGQQNSTYLFKTDVCLIRRKGSKEYYCDANSWLRKKAEKIGVEFLNYNNEDSYIKIKCKDTAKKSTIEGRLVVTHPERFIKALQTGISRKKAFGFGLLSLIPCNP